MNLSSYETWLKDEGYQPTTIKASVRALQRQDLKNPAALPSDKVRLQRYLLFTQVSGEHPLGQGFSRALKRAGLRPAQVRAKGGNRQHPVLGLKQFGKLMDALKECDDDAARMLVLYMNSGMRINAFLSQTRAQTATAVPPSWLLEQPKRKKLYEVLSPSLTWARRKMLRVLQQEAARLGVDADLDTVWRSRDALITR